MLLNSSSREFGTMVWLKLFSPLLQFRILINPKCSNIPPHYNLHYQESRQVGWTIGVGIVRWGSHGYASTQRTRPMNFHPFSQRVFRNPSGVIIVREPMTKNYFFFLGMFGYIFRIMIRRPLRDPRSGSAPWGRSNVRRRESRKNWVRHTGYF